MNKKEKQQQLDYPVKTTHEFFSEISNEWGHFKRGAIMSLIVCSLLLVGFVFAFLRATKIHSFEFSGLFLVLPIAGFLVYTIYLMISQYRFFRRWEKRMKHIYSYEEKLLADDGKSNREQDRQTTLSHT
jgi:membrane protein CcdC involved in cytochrome C biogenesis